MSFLLREAMNHRSLSSFMDGEPPKEVAAPYSAFSLTHSALFSDSEVQSSPIGECSSSCLPSYVHETQHSSPHFISSYSHHPQRVCANLGQPSPLPPSPRLFSRSSMFCTNLYLSSSSSSETHRQLGNLPFLPHPQPNKPSHSSVQSTIALDLFNEDLSKSNDDGNPEELTHDFTNFLDDTLDRNIREMSYSNECLDFREQLDLQFLSDQLDMAIGDPGENPGIDEIYEAPPTSAEQAVPSNVNNRSSMPLLEFLSCKPSHELATHKPRMRWTSELHEQFVEAVNKLDGAEDFHLHQSFISTQATSFRKAQSGKRVLKRDDDNWRLVPRALGLWVATPKAVLKLMNVEGLTIYHVKSHLQKYRLAKYIPEKKEENESSGCEEKKAASSSTGHDGRRKGRTPFTTEALRLQMEVQKQLYEQLEVQKDLQLRIEEHAKYLQKMLDEQQKAGSSFVSSQSNSCSTSPRIGGSEVQSSAAPPVAASPSQPAAESKSDSSSKRKVSESSNSQQEISKRSCVTGSLSEVKDTQ